MDQGFQILNNAATQSGMVKKCKICGKVLNSAKALSGKAKGKLAQQTNSQNLDAWAKFIQDDYQVSFTYNYCNF